MREYLGSHLDGRDLCLEYRGERGEASGSFSYERTLSIDSKTRTCVVVCLASIREYVDLGEWGVCRQVETIE